jgi:hypothetical protein
MSQEEFDTFARTLAETRTRRQALKALAGGLLTVVGGGALAALAPKRAEAAGGPSPCAMFNEKCTLLHRCCPHMQLMCFESRCVPMG